MNLPLKTDYSHQQWKFFHKKEFFSHFSGKTFAVICDGILGTKHKAVLFVRLMLKWQRRPHKEQESSLSQLAGQATRKERKTVLSARLERTDEVDCSGNKKPFAVIRSQNKEGGQWQYFLYGIVRTDDVMAVKNKKEGLESRCAFRIGVGRKIHSKTPKPPLTYHVHEINASVILLNFCRLQTFLHLLYIRFEKKSSRQEEAHLMPSTAALTMPPA